MTLKELIGNANYDRIEFYLIYDENESLCFAGVAKSENGKLISLDGDSYDINCKVIDHEFSNDGKTLYVTVEDF